MVNEDINHNSAQRIVAITGGALGIGGAVSRMFASEGAHVVLRDIDARAAKETASEIRASGGEVSVVVADVTTEAGIDALESAVREVGGGRIDVLVNNVG